MMRARPRDKCWQPWPVLADTTARAWLLDEGSLTARIKARCRAFELALLCQERMKIPREEAELLGLDTRERAIGRNVLLKCGSVPLVFAHSVLRPADLKGCWRSIDAMGSNPLGAALFADPRIQRRPFAFRRLGPGHPLYCAAAKAVGQVLPPIWARRSTFALRGAPLLVTEAFLPGIEVLSRSRTTRS